MPLPYEARRAQAKSRREQEKRNAEAVKASEQANAPENHPPLGSVELRRKELALQAEQDARNAEALEAGEKRLREEYEDKSLAGPPENKADLQEKTKAELYDIASDLDIDGRSGMSKGELVKAIRKAQG